MINGQKEIWFAIDHRVKMPTTIIAISNCGRIMRNNGNIDVAKLRDGYNLNGKRYRFYQLLAEKMLPKSEDDILKNRNYIDHISHKPKDMYINDIRNLRWCTKKENERFDEARINNSKGKQGIFGKKFFEHFNKLCTADKVLYRKERKFFIKNGYCSWEK